jgi:hypothetical protein
MADDVLTILSRITTVSDMTQAFSDEDQCRRLLEAMVWPRGRICPACGYKRSTSISGRDWGKTKRPGLYQCSNSACHHQFTVTTRTPLHSTKLPLRLWLQGLWLILQSDKGLSSVRLGEALGISQQASWRMGHALRLLMTNEKPLEGTVEIDELRIGGTPHKPAGNLGPGPGRGRRGQPRTTKTPVLALVQRPEDRDVGTQAGSVRAAVVDDASAAETARVMSDAVAPDIHLMSDEWSTFMALGSNFAAHDTVQHSEREYARGIVHVNSVEGFNARVRRTVAGVFHHISPRHADLYLTEIGFRWSQRTITGQAVRRTRKGREVVRIQWDRIAPAHQFITLFASAVGRQLRRTKEGSISIKSTVAAFG